MVIETKKTPGGRMRIIEEEEIRYLYVGRALESAMYLSGDRTEPVFPYIALMADWIRKHEKIRKIMLIGSGGFQLPRALMHTGMEMHAFEISHDMVEMSEKYFELAELKKLPNFHLHEEDGFAWLREHEDAFDCIINDAFIGKKPQGMDQASAECIRRHLNPSGAYLINAVTALKGPLSKRKKIIASLRMSFDQVDWMIGQDEISLYEVQNCLVIAR